MTPPKHRRSVAENIITKKLLNGCILVTIVVIISLAADKTTVVSASTSIHVSHLDGHSTRINTLCKEGV